MTCSTPKTISELRARSRSAPLKKNTLRQNQYGFVLSGPVVIPKVYNGRNKTFWAFNYEASRTREGQVATANFPVDAFRRGFLGAFRTATSQRTVRSADYHLRSRHRHPFPNNIIPSSRIHPGARNVLNCMCRAPQFVQSDILDFTARATVPLHQRQYLFRPWDHNFSENDRVFARLAWDRSNLTRITSIRTCRSLLRRRSPTLPRSGSTLRAHRDPGGPVGFNISDDLTSNPRTDNTTFDMDALGVGHLHPRDGNRKLTPREHGIPNFGGLPFTLQELTARKLGYDNMDTIQPSAHYTWVTGKTYHENRRRILPDQHGARCRQHRGRSTQFQQSRPADTRLPVF